MARSIFIIMKVFFCEIIWKLLPGILQKSPIAFENAKSEK